MWLSLEDETGLEWSIVCLPETEGFLGRWTFSATIRMSRAEQDGVVTLASYFSSKPKCWGQHKKEEMED